MSKKLSRNAKYEKRRIEEENVMKITLWVPPDTKPDFDLMASYCRDHRSCTPEMVRCSTTGQMKKAI